MVAMFALSKYRYAHVYIDSPVAVCLTVMVSWGTCGGVVAWGVVLVHLVWAA